MIPPWALVVFGIVAVILLGLAAYEIHHHIIEERRIRREVRQWVDEFEHRNTKGKK
jgi:hypothetical protein